MKSTKTAAVRLSEQRCFKNVVEAISTGGQTGPHTLRVTTEGIDKPVLQMILIAGYITTNGVHVACKQSKELE